MTRNGITWLRRRLAGLVYQDAGVTTAEYAMCAIGAAAFAGTLYVVLTSERVANALTQIIERALTVSF